MISQQKKGVFMLTIAGGVILGAIGLWFFMMISVGVLMFVFSLLGIRG